ncbi:MAG: hypothetical protein A7316_02630 [Candidatus Altiarchaeales archaeon WOR_SM1_86-2]|nr:MAG: hypothetical protein A7316_02630 [Candidatus Altiarchaeales archaeon WOR_SM1_86-2]ODS39436.1 MAG: hypothetical protein A7315_11080 [Candidatus Altiarchaeales archaeon WOR_SM1_79]
MKVRTLRIITEALTAGILTFVFYLVLAMVLMMEQLDAFFMGAILALFTAIFVNQRVFLKRRWENSACDAALAAAAVGIVWVVSRCVLTQCWNVFIC